MKECKHLVAIEVDWLIAATKSSRNAARDRCRLLLMFRHGLRVSEVCGLSCSKSILRAGCCTSFVSKKGSQQATLAYRRTKGNQGMVVSSGQGAGRDRCLFYQRVAYKERHSKNPSKALTGNFSYVQGKEDSLKGEYAHDAE